MKVFNKVEGFLSKVNFVDDDNTFVGYDTFQGCCEYAGFFFSNSITDDPNYDLWEHEDESYSEEELKGYNFDKTFFKDLENNSFDQGRMVCFRLTKEGWEDLFLHLFNCHNGYYSHGFEFKNGGEVIKEGDC